MSKHSRKFLLWVALSIAFSSHPKLTFLPPAYATDDNQAFLAELKKAKIPAIERLSPEEKKGVYTRLETMRKEERIAFLILLAHAHSQSGSTTSDSSKRTLEKNESLQSESLLYHDNLLKTGFVQLGDSRFYMQGHVIIEITSEMELTSGLMHAVLNILVENLYSTEDETSQKDWKYVPLGESSEGKDLLWEELREAPIVPERKSRLPGSPLGSLLVSKSFEFEKEASLGNENNGFYFKKNYVQSMLILLKNGELDRVFQRNGGSINYKRVYGGKLPKESLKVTSVHSKIVVVKNMFDQIKGEMPVTEVTLTNGKRDYVVSSGAGMTVRKAGAAFFSFWEDMKNTPVYNFMPFPSELSLYWPDPKTESQTGFIIGGKNSDETLKKLTTLNEVPIHKIEVQLKENYTRLQKNEGSSESHDYSMPELLSIGPDESLLELLREDNQLVTEELHTTHQEIAKAMIWARDVAKCDLKGKDKYLHVSYHHADLNISCLNYLGFIGSSFGEKPTVKVLETSIEVINLKNHEVVHFSSIDPEMIWRYGFYFGKHTRHRVNPQTIVKIFEIPPGSGS